MIELKEITSSASQLINVIGEKNERITLELFFRPTQEGWFMNVAYEDFEVKGKRIVQSPNLLRQYHNIIPFGISCNLTDETEPFFIDDFVEKRAKLSLLTAEEVTQSEEYFTA